MRPRTSAAPSRDAETPIKEELNRDEYRFCSDVVARSLGLQLPANPAKSPRGLRATERAVVSPPSLNFRENPKSRDGEIDRDRRKPPWR